MMVTALFVCFSENIWYFVLCLVMSSIYLTVLTAQYIQSDSESDYGCSLQYGCQIASFNSRLSILSNVTIAFFGIVFSILTSYYLIIPPSDNIDDKYFDLNNNSFIIGCFKLMFIYIISNKIHSLQLLLSILIRSSQTVRTLNIDNNDEKCRYPIIFVDDKKISSLRYYVTGYKNKVAVFFDPPLSVNNTSDIKYTFIPEDENHIINDQPPYNLEDISNCPTRCKSSCNININNQ